MKTCNNCSTENHIAAQKCVHCNMEGNFTFQEMPMEAPHVNEDVIICRNCASENPGNGIKCIQCNFPIMSKTKSEHSISKIPIKANLRLG